MTRLLRYKLPIAILIGVLLRVGVLLAFPGVFNYEDTGAVHGSAAYDTYAQNLLATGVYGREPGEPDAFIPPGYSYALALVYGAIGRGGVQVGLFNTLLDVAAMILIYHIGLRLFGGENRERGEWVGFGAVLFFAGYPYLIFQNLTVIDTPLYMVLMFAFLLAIIALRDQTTLDGRTWALAVLCGGLLGISTLVRPVLPVLALFLPLWFLFRHTLWAMLIRLGAVAMISAIVVLGWTWRNYTVYQDFVPLTTTSGANFWQGNSEYTVPLFRAGYDVQWTSPELETEDRNSLEADAERFALGIEYLQENPGAIPELMWVKFLVHWSIDVQPLRNPLPGATPVVDYRGEIVQVDADGEIVLEGVPENDPTVAYSQPLFDRLGRTIHRYYYGALFMLCLVGMALTWRLWRDVSLLWLTQIAMTIVYVLIHPSTRYRAPTDPLLFLFSAAALYIIYDWWQDRTVSPERSIRDSQDSLSQAAEK